MPKATPEERLKQIDASRLRWQRRLTRATNALGKLEKQRRRLANAILAEGSKGLPVIATVKLKALPAPHPEPDLETQIEGMVEEHVAAFDKRHEQEDLTIPPFLKREGDLQKRIEEAKRIDAETAAKHKAEVEKKRKLKARGRIARLKAKAAGELTAMPLTGRAALKAIRRGSP